jgi:hypothetical protein
MACGPASCISAGIFDARVSHRAATGDEQRARGERSRDGEARRLAPVHVISISSRRHGGDAYDARHVPFPP